MTTKCRMLPEPHPERIQHFDAIAIQSREEVRGKVLEVVAQIEHDYFNRPSDQAAMCCEGPWYLITDEEHKPLVIAVCIHDISMD